MLTDDCANLDDVALDMTNGGRRDNQILIGQECWSQASTDSKIVQVIVEPQNGEPVRDILRNSWSDVYQKIDNLDVAGGQVRRGSILEIGALDQEGKYATALTQCLNIQSKLECLRQFERRLQQMADGNLQQSDLAFNHSDMLTTVTVIECLWLPANCRC